MIFLDTGFLFALLVDDDVNHKRVCEVFEPYGERPLEDLILTTNHVVAETVTLLRKRGHPDPAVRHRLAVAAGEQLFAGTFGSIHQATAEEERTALELLAKQVDKDYSFVDCLSFVVMERLGIREALAVDADFTHRFTARPGPRS